MEIQMDIVFNRPVEMDAFQRAADETLSLFPEFSAQLVIKNGRLKYMDDQRPARVILTDDPDTMTVNYCTADTNGHVCYFFVDSRDRRKVTFSYLHGMSDFNGGMRMLKTLLYRYQMILSPERSAAPEELHNAGIRIDIPEDWERPENLDPYSNCWTEENTSAPIAAETPFSVQGLELYPAGTEVNHIWHVTVDSMAFLGKCREAATGFAPMIIDTLIETVAECFNAGKENVIVFLPVDMRSVFGMNTVTNFSDSVALSMNGAQRCLPVRERCNLLKRSINEQRTKEHQGPILLSKAHAARNMMNDPEGYINVATRSAAPFLSGETRKAPMTFVATYPGRTDLPSCLDGLVNSLMPVSVMGRIKFYFLISSYGNVMTIQVLQRFDDDRLVRALVHQLKQMDLEVQAADMGLRRQGCLQPDKLTVLE